jgi:hypothetical protein
VFAFINIFTTSASVFVLTFNRHPIPFSKLFLALRHKTDTSITELLLGALIHLHLVLRQAVFLACIFPFPRLASLIFVARTSTPTLKTAGYAGYLTDNQNNYPKQDCNNQNVTGQ